MKATATATALLFALNTLSTAVATLSPSSTYTLKLTSRNPRLNSSTVVVKVKSSSAAYPNPLGSFSTGKPRHAYTFTVSTLSAPDLLYELKSSVKQTHLILNGDPIAPQLFETVIGQDPTAVTNKVTRSKFIIGDDMMLRGAEENRNAAGGFLNGAGSWRACNDTTVDYQLFWFDGLHNLTAVAGDCESVGLVLSEVTPGVSSTVLPVTTVGWITGVPAPTTTGVPAPTSSCFLDTTTTTVTSDFITGVPAPSQYPSAASQITVRIFNDQTGANAAASIPADGTSHNIVDLFRGSTIDNNGDVIGTSALLVKFSHTTKCALKNVNVQDWVVELDGRAKNFADLDGDSSKAVPVWLNGFMLSCVYV